MEPRLPTELLILIATFIGERRNLVTLCRLFKKFRVFCTPLLYKAVSIGPNQQTRTVHVRLDRTLQSASISHIIAEFYAILGKRILYPRWNGTNIFKRHYTCDTHERAIGAAILSLDCPNIS
jgi:hypothetical protein